MIETRCTMIFYHVMPVWNHITLMTSSIAPLHLLIQDDQNEMQHDFSVIWHCWHWYQHHGMPMALSIAPLLSLGWDDWNNVQHNILAMWCHWCCCQWHMILMVSSMVPFHLLVQDDQIEMQLDFIAQVMPLAPASTLCDTNDIINGTTAFV